MALLGSGKRSFLAIYIDIKIAGSIAHSNISTIIIDYQKDIFEDYESSKRTLIIANIKESPGFAKQ